MTQKSNLKITKRFGTCSKDCYGSCVFTGLWDDFVKELKFLDAKPQISHPFTKGFFCSKLNDRKSLLYHPERLKTCFIRIKEKGRNEFKPINNNSAIEIITKKVNEIKNTYGSDVIIGAFNAGNYGLISRYAPLRFFKELGATITTGGICNEGGCAGLTNLFGTYSITNPLQILNPETELIVIWGSNISERNNHAYSFIKKVQSNGVKLVVLDSQYTPIARQADIFISTIPGMDHIIALIISKYIIQNKFQDNEFLDKYTEAYNDLYEKLIQFNENEYIEPLGLNLEQISHFIKLLQKHQGHTIFNIGFGVQKDYKGGNIVQLIALVQILLGNIGKPGTGIIYSQSDFNKVILKPLTEYITSISSKDNIHQINLIDLGKELQREHYKMIFIYNFNPLSSLPNQNLVRKSFLRKDLFIVVQELFLNETTKYADIVIPSKFDLESYDLIAPYYIPGISLNYAGPCPYSNCISNFEFYRLVSEMMDWKNVPELKEDDRSIFYNCINLLPLNIRKTLLSQGYHLLFKVEDIPFNDMVFPTLNNKINLFGLDINFGFNRLKKIRNRKKNTFFLITPPHKYHIHSQLGQLNKKSIDNFKRIYIGKDDMQSLDLEEGRRVLVYNQYGKGEFTLTVSPYLSKGIALIYSGSPFDFKDSINPNIFTPDNPEELGASGSYNSAIIKIERLS